jgi:hypothetical protein
MTENRLRKWVRKAGWALLWLAWGVQIGGLALMVDSDPYRAVPADRVRVAPADDAISAAVEQGRLVVEVKTANFTQMYGNWLYFSLIATTLGIFALRGTETYALASREEKVEPRGRCPALTYASNSHPQQAAQIAPRRLCLHPSHERRQTADLCSS